MPFWGPCGAESGGGGGAPPTTLILLRNQCPVALGDRACSVRPSEGPRAPTTVPAGTLAGRQSLPPPASCAPTTATLRVALAGRQILTRFARALRALSSARQNLPSRDGSLRFDRLASLVRGGDLRSVHCDRAVAMGPTHRVQPKGLSGGKGQSPHLVRMCKHIRLSGPWTYRPSSRASTAHAADDGPRTSSDGAPRSHHPATLCPLAKGSTCMPQESGMVDPIASLLWRGMQGGVGTPLPSRAQWGVP